MAARIRATSRDAWCAWRSRTSGLPTRARSRSRSMRPRPTSGSARRKANWHWRRRCVYLAVAAKSQCRLHRLQRGARIRAERRLAARADAPAQRADEADEGTRLRQGLPLRARRGGRLRGGRKLLSRRHGAAAFYEPASGLEARIRERLAELRARDAERRKDRSRAAALARSSPDCAEPAQRNRHAMRPHITQSSLTRFQRRTRLRHLVPRSRGDQQQTQPGGPTAVTRFTMLDIHLLRKDLPAPSPASPSGLRARRRGLQCARGRAQGGAGSRRGAAGAAQRAVEADRHAEVASGEDTSAVMAEVAAIPATRSRAARRELGAHAGAAERVPARRPEPPHASVPAGRSTEDNVEVRRWGEPSRSTSRSRDHVDLGAALGSTSTRRRSSRVRASR